MTDRDIAEAAEFASESRLLAYGRAPGVESGCGPGWVAVLTGVQSNDMNGVVSEVGAEIDATVVRELLAWFAGAAVPASWLTRRPAPALTAALVAAGARPERTGSWSGRPMPADLWPGDAEVEVVRVVTDEDLDRWLALAVRCAWIETSADRERRRALYRGLGLGRGGLVHWLGLVDGEPVAFASSYLAADVVDLCNLGVLATHRRRGIGRALVAARLADAKAQGARLVVSAPSHDGWQLQRSLGFRSVPVVPDTCCYLPF